MNKFLGMRYSLIFMLLPLVIIIVVLTTVFSIFEARSAITALANRHMAFKAEELRDFAYSEMETLRSLELENNPDLMAAAEKSIMSYSLSLLRNVSEVIYIFDGEKNLIWELNVTERIRKGETAINTESVSFKSGWLKFKSNDEQRIGILFDFTPFDWYIIVSDLESAFFAEIQDIERNSLVILIISIASILVLTPLSLGHTVRHVEELSAAALDITENFDFSKRADITSDDETGLLAERFNSMLDTLQDSIEAEKSSREAAEEQEREALFLLSRISDIRDENTGNHLKRIGLMSELMGRLLNLDRKEQLILLNSAPLHDIGKIGVPDSILLKPGRLTDDEFNLIKTHTTLGYKLLESSNSIFLREGANIALTHHEKWDGSGYPSGLSGKNISLYGRIVSIVDVFDALVSERPYKASMPVEEACDMILAQSGKHFDPVLVDLFVQNFRLFLTARNESNVTR